MIMQAALQNQRFFVDQSLPNSECASEAVGTKEGMATGEDFGYS